MMESKVKRDAKGNTEEGGRGGMSKAEGVGRS